MKIDKTKIGSLLSENHVTFHVVVRQLVSTISCLSLLSSSSFVRCPNYGSIEILVRSKYVLDLGFNSIVSKYVNFKFFFYKM